MIKGSINYGQSLFEFHFRHKLCIVLVLCVFLVSQAQKPEVVPHDQVPLFQLVQHLQLFYLLPFLRLNTVVVYFGHRQAFRVFPSTALEPHALVLQVRILVNSNKWTPHHVEIPHHHLPEPVVRVVHFIIEKVRKGKLLVDELQQIIDPVGFNVTKYALSVKQSRSFGIDSQLIQYVPEFLGVGQVTSCEFVFLAAFEERMRRVNF